jgi:hypothetical protein
VPPSPTAAAAPTETPGPPRAAGIIFLGTNGRTVWRAHTDGSGAETLFSIDVPEQGSVLDLSAGPSGKQVVYGVARGPEDHQPVYYIWSEGTGTAKEIAPLSGAPHWSPDRQALVGQTFSASGFGGPIYLYGVSNGRGLRLPAEGTPDFFPGARQIVYVFKDNIYTYDLDSGSNAQLTYLPNDDQNAWTVQEAHVLPGGKQIAFFGGQFRKDGELVLGAQGNGQQWWAIPVEGGEGHPLTEPGGNLKKIELIKHGRCLKAAFHIPAAKAVIFIHHGFKGIAIEHGALAGHELSARAGQHELGVEDAQKSRLFHHGLGEIIFIRAVAFPADSALNGLYRPLEIKNALADFVVGILINVRAGDRGKQQALK